MKILAVVVLVVMLVVGGIAIHMKKAEEREFQAKIEGEPEASVTADQIIGHFRDDRFSAQREYHDKLVDVTGLVSKINLDDDPPTVRLGQGSMAIMCSFNFGQTPDSLKQDDLATLRGLVLITETDITMEYCRVVE